MNRRFLPTFLGYVWLAALAGALVVLGLVSLAIAGAVS